MALWYIATEVFTPHAGEAWTNYIAWSGLTQLEEVVSLDPMLCPTLLPDIKDEYWPHIVNEDFMLNFFTDLAFLLAQLPDTPERNLLCVIRNPPPTLSPTLHGDRFGLLGYDLVDVHGSASALTNCGGFPHVFDNRELSCKGLITSHARALHVQSDLRAKHPEDFHANCHVWGIYRAVAV
jgi:hypothetical protein